MTDLIKILYRYLDVILNFTSYFTFYIINLYRILFTFYIFAFLSIFIVLILYYLKTIIIILLDFMILLYDLNIPFIFTFDICTF